MSAKQKFRIGQLVTWTSSSAGTAKKKTGVVERVCPPGHRPTDILGEKCGLQRGHESYVVVVKETKAHRPRRYWPIASKLEAA